MRAFRPEGEIRGSEILLSELEGVLAKAKSNINVLRESILAKENELVEALNAKIANGEEGPSKLDILIESWRNCSNELKESPKDSKLQKDLMYIEDDLANEPTQQFDDERASSILISDLRADIIAKIAHLRTLEDFLEDWEKETLNTSNDQRLLELRLADLKKRYESIN